MNGAGEFDNLFKKLNKDVVDEGKSVVGVSYASSEEMARTGAPIGHIGYPKDIVLQEAPYSVTTDLSNVTDKGGAARNKAIEAIMNEDLKDINFTAKPQYNPFLTSGISSVSNGPVSQIGKFKFSNREDLMDTILHEEIHNRFKIDGVYGQEYEGVFHHHPPRGIYAEYEVYQKFIDMWKASPTEETYKKILELARDTKEWWR